MPDKLDLSAFMEQMADKMKEAEAGQPMFAEDRHRESEQDRVTRDIMAALDALGGQNVTEDALIFQGSQFVLPANMEGDIAGAVKYLRNWAEQQKATFNFSRTFKFRPYDGAAAFERAMKRVFGSTGIGRATVTFFGSRPPEYQSIPSGAHGETIQVPWGRVEFSPIEATFVLGADIDKEFGIVFELSVEAPRKHRRRIEGFFAIVEDELNKQSLYKGKAITSDGMKPDFLPVDTLDTGKVIYTEEVMTQLDVNLWSPLMYTAELEKAGVPFKRAVLLEGPNGTGKTMAGLRTAQIAQEHGVTFIMVKAGEDPLEALRTARIYAPAVVWVEDLDVVASSDENVRNRRKMSQVLDVLDGMQGKGAQVMTGFTTNFVDKLEKGVLRPGRLDAVVHIGELDRPGYEKLVRALVPSDLLADDVDYDAVYEAFKDADGKGFLPAFAAEATQRAIRYGVSRNLGRPTSITTADLVDAAFGMRDHLALMARAESAGSRKTTIEYLVGEAAELAMHRTKGDVDFGTEVVTFSENKDAE